MHVAVATSNDTAKSDSTSGYIFKIFMANSTVSWWVDTSATRHICVDQTCFTSLQGVDE